MKILITGGPVHAYLDAVKIITNKFRGGLMSELAEQFNKIDNVTVYYLTAKGSKEPNLGHNPSISQYIYHDGLYDYRDKVLKLAPLMDAVILGAAVANLIPAEPIKGKFPSHNYKVGDIIPINFTIAPRIIDMVKEVAPNTHLFGFKLLAGVSHDELIHAAYETLLWSKSTAVFANQTDDLTKKFIVTKERGVQPIHKDDIVKFVIDCVKDEYYSTRVEINDEYFCSPLCSTIFNKLKEQYENRFPMVPEGYVFGTIAVKNIGGKGFLTTGRGKNELDDTVFVYDVDHSSHVVHALNKKATLNAPLLDLIFKTNPKVHAIVHLHEQMETLYTQPYAPSGTVRDTRRQSAISFNVQGHGCYLLINEDGKIIR